MTSVKDTLSKLLTLEKSANTVFQEREELIRLVIACAIGSRKNKGTVPGHRLNMSIVGPPGAAKTMVLKYIMSAFDGARFGSYQIHRQTKFEEVYGQPDFEELKKGNYIIKWKDKAANKELVLFDEGWNGSSSFLQACHEHFNEGTFYDGSEKFTTPLIFGAFASNKLPGEELNAMYDRCSVRLHVPHIQEMGSFIRMLQMKEADGLAPENKMTLDDLEEVQEYVDSIEVSDDALRKVHEIRARLHAKGKKEVSDRRFKNGLRLGKAFAFLNGNEQVTDEDLECFEHVLWNKTNEINLVREVVYEAVNPQGMRVMELYRNAIEGLELAKAENDEGKRNNMLSDANHKLTESGDEIDKIITEMKEDGRMTGKYEALRNKLDRIHNELASEWIGDLGDLVD